MSPGVMSNDAGSLPHAMDGMDTRGSHRDPPGSDRMFAPVRNFCERE
jgi:hypothetical protein